eukprot:jgi/Bigna1/131289/aug1.14_g5997
MGCPLTDESSLASRRKEQKTMAICWGRARTATVCWVIRTAHGIRGTQKWESSWESDWESSIAGRLTGRRLGDPVGLDVAGDSVCGCCVAGAPVTGCSVTGEAVLGDRVGLALTGLDVGVLLGEAVVGEDVGLLVGAEDGPIVGLDVGALLGEAVVGVHVGLLVGAEDGPVVGLNEGRRRTLASSTNIVKSPFGKQAFSRKRVVLLLMAVNLEIRRRNVIKARYERDESQ